MANSRVWRFFRKCFEKYSICEQQIINTSTIQQTIKQLIQQFNKHSTHKNGRK